jgi:hypothetical protein
MDDRAGSHRFEVIRGISKKFKEKNQRKEKIKENKNYIFLIFQKFIFLKITEITCADGIAMPTAHHGRQPIATAEPVPMPSYAEGDVPTVAVGTDYADGRRPSTPCPRPVVRP